MIIAPHPKDRHLRMRKSGPLAMALLLCLLLSTAGAADDARVKQGAAELDRVRARIQTLQQKLDRDRGRQDELQTQLQSTEQKIGELTDQLRDLRAQIEKQSGRVRATQGERGQAERDLRAHKASLGRQIRSAYLIGQRAKTKLLLSQNDTQRVSRVMVYYDYLNAARAQHIRGILEQIDKLGKIEARLQQETAELQATRSEQEGTLTTLEANRLERGRMMAKLTARITGEQSQLKRLQANEAELRKLLESLQYVLSDIPADLGNQRPFAKSKGRLPWPLHGRLLARFGQPKLGGRLKWNGLWIQGREGDPVKAVARGRVAYVGWMNRYGLIIVLEHDGGFYSLYGHNQSARTSIGEWVNPGDVIASVGNTGGYDQAGLYFELRKGTEPVNPTRWLGR